MVNAVVLAGDSGDSPVQDVKNKALIKIQDRFMIEYIVDSLIQAACVDRIIIVGPEYLKEVIGDKVEAVFDSTNSIIENMRKGISGLSDGKHVIVCTCDIPLVSGEAIEDFVNQCLDKKVDIGYPIIEKSLNDKKYPDAKRTYVKMREGIYTGGNIIYINPLVLDGCCKIAEDLVENRKSPIRMGKVIGIGTLIRLSLGILRVGSVEKRARKLFGINIRAIETLYPEIGNDVDKIDDIEFVKKYI